MSELLYLPQVDSTNLCCKRRLGEMGHLDAVWSASQTAGRGRREHVWENAPGQALYYSILFQGGLAQPECLPLASSLAAAWALENCFGPGLEIAIKWPNDLLLGGKKAVGILCEGFSGAWVSGIGVNLCQSAADFAAAGLPHATSVALRLGRDPGPDAAARLAKELTRIFRQDGRLAEFYRRGFAALADEYRARCVNLRRRVTFAGGAGVARAVDDDGRLVVEADGGERHLLSGEVSVQGIYGCL